ncbi:MAG: hypothetical protein ACD_79C01242G0004 [uncultured bacterium]|nr:MAG: hypothetical protein ACD_79C01242G0004 [uncultured bacterium]
MDKYQIDSHKLMYHVPRVNDWLQGKTIYPIYMEVSPSGACNHRCTYCGLDFMEYKPEFLDVEKFKKTLTEIGLIGVKSIMFAGEGEPLLHKNIAEIVKHTKKSGIDVAFTTNGVLLNEKISKEILPYTEWIKISITAGTRKTYAKIHQTKESDFDKVIENITNAVKIKQNENYQCSIGMQLLLLPDNYNEVELLADIGKKTGCDYLVVKPYSQHLMSKTAKYKDIEYKDAKKLCEKLESYNSENFKIIFRIQAMNNWNQKEKKYEHCYALPFWSYLDSSGNVWACSCYLTDDKFNLGNIYSQSFEEICNSFKRSQIMKWSENELNTKECRTNCRMNAINQYLWDLKHPVSHVNFI